MLIDWAGTSIEKINLSYMKTYIIIPAYYLSL